LGGREEKKMLAGEKSNSPTNGVRTHQKYLFQISSNKGDLGKMKRFFSGGRKGFCVINSVF